MNLVGVAQYLEDEGVATRGISVFVNNMPAGCDQGLLMRHPFGGTEIDHELPGYRKTSFMLIARAKDFETVDALMVEATTALTVSEADLPGMRVNYMRPRNEPLPFANTDAGNIELLVHMDACYVIV